MLTHLWRRLTQQEPQDCLIADLISLNTYRYRPGMECADWSRIQQRGDQRWTDTVRARKAMQRRASR